MKVTDENSRIRIRIRYSELWIPESVQKFHGTATLLERPPNYQIVTVLRSCVLLCFEPAFTNQRALFGRVYMDHGVMTVQAADLERLRAGLEKGRRGSEPLMEGAAAVGDLFLCAEGKELPARGRIIKVRTQNSCSRVSIRPSGYISQRYGSGSGSFPVLIKMLSELKDFLQKKL